MARHLCIVARESSPLYGYLTIAFRDRPPGAPTIDIVLDRRHPDAKDHSMNGGGPDRRRHSGVDESIRTKGYAIYTGPGGGAPSRSDEAFIERAIGLLADVERRGPLALRFNARRRALATGLRRGAVVALALAVVITAVLRVGGVGRVVDDAAAWTDATVQRLEEAWVAIRGDGARPAPERDRDAGGPAVASSPNTAPAVPAERAAPAERPVPPAPVAAPAEAPRPPSPVVVPETRPVEASRAPASGREAGEGAPARGSRETAAAVEARPLPAFTGLPRVDMSRQPGPSGAGVVYSVRLTDPAGQAVPGAQIWLRGTTADGQTRETPLDDAQRPGVYSSGVLPPDLMPPSLSVRVHFSNMRVEIPVDY
jgi:hypothetical protein